MIEEGLGDFIECVQVTAVAQVETFPVESSDALRGVSPSEFGCEAEFFGCFLPGVIFVQLLRGDFDPFVEVSEMRIFGVEFFEECDCLFAWW
jgi:hypothetical protein